jgi:hypothetical protein
MDVVTIATYAKPEEAHLARLRLCREDIPAYVVGEHVVQMSWRHTITVGGVRLQVAEDDIEEAQALLRAEPVVMEGPDCCVSCPQCGTEKAEIYFWARRCAGLTVVFALPLFLLSRWHRWKCGTCGHTWR